MRFKELSATDKEYLSTIYRQEGLTHNERLDILTKKFEVVPRTIRLWAKNLGISSEFSASRMSKSLFEASQRSISDDSKILLVTSAQNKTSVNPGFMKSLENYRDFLTSIGYPAEIVVIPVKYRNPTSLSEQANRSTEDWWVDEVTKYLHYSKVSFGDTVISANSRIVPTASMPLSGYESLAADNHLILGHPRVHFRTLPRFRDMPLRVMASTGFCTLKHYSNSRAGDLGYIHHSYGFTIVEKKADGTCHIPRCVKANSDGSFTDLIYHATPEYVELVTTCKGLVLGDIHHSELDHDKMQQTISLIDQLRPEEVVLHDVFDGSTINPHETKDLYIKRRKIVEGRNNLKREVDSALDFIHTFSNSIGDDISVNIVASNHDVFLDRHVNNFDWKKDLHNSPAFLEYAYIQQNEDLSEHDNIFGFLVNTKTPANYLPYGQGHMIGEYQSGHHGDVGTNGAKASPISMKRLNQKMIFAHTHSPLIIDGVTVVGVSCHLNQYYNRKGLSSWAYADSIVHDSGKSQLVVYGDDYQVSNLLGHEKEEV